MSARMATIRNDFHGTVTRVRTGRMMLANARRVASRLCGVAGCTCGGVLGERGPQRGVVIYQETQDTVIVSLVSILNDGKRS